MPESIEPSVKVVGMSRLNELLHRGEKWATDNSPTILTALGVVGVVSTAVLASKASIRAVRLIDEAAQSGYYVEPLSNKERFEIIWKLYIPAVTTGVFTCTCIIGANRIGNRRAAAMASAFALSERAFDEYREQVVKQIGKAKEHKVREAVAEERVRKNPPKEQEIVRTQGGDCLYQDAYSSRYFWSDAQSIQRAVNEINNEMLNQGYASLSDFYDKLGLSHTRESDNLGWNASHGHLLEVSYIWTCDDKNRPVGVLDFSVDPIRDFFRAR